MRDSGWEILYVPEAEVIHDYRRTSAQQPLSTFAARQLAAHVHFQRKWWSRRTGLIAAGRAMDAEAEAAAAPRLDAETVSA
jgi:GT2 family glycosyltransferase